MARKYYAVNPAYSGPELDVRVICSEEDGRPITPGVTLFLLPGERVRTDDVRAQEALEALVVGRKDGIPALVEAGPGMVHVNLDANVSERREFGPDEQRRRERGKPHGPPQHVMAREKKLRTDRPEAPLQPIAAPDRMHIPTSVALALVAVACAVAAFLRAC